MKKWVCGDQDKKLIKAAQHRGAIGRLIEVNPWQNGTTLLIAKGSDIQDPEIVPGLQPKTVAVECLRPEGWTKPALDIFARDLASIVTPEGKDSWTQLKTGNLGTLRRLCRRLLMPRMLIRD